MENKFNEQESLKLITEMIAQARSNFQKGAGNGMIFWGYIIAILAFINYILLVIFKDSCAYWVWALTIPVFIVHTIIENKKSKRDLVITHIDRVIGDVWIAFFISAIVVVISIYSLAFGLDTYYLFLLITPAIMTMSGLSIFITGKLCRFKPYVYGGFCFWLGTIISAALPLLTHRQDIQFLVLAICMIVGFVIPGHMLNRKAEHDV